MRPALISEVRVEKKPRFTSSALTRARSRSRQSIQLSRSKTRQETLDFLFSLFLLYEIKKNGEENCDAMEERKGEFLEENLDETSRTSGMRGELFGGLTLSSYSPASWIGGGLLEGNQADNPINKLARIHMPCISLLFSI